jgi:hypothetical protein
MKSIIQGTSWIFNKIGGSQTTLLCWVLEHYSTLMWLACFKSNVIDVVMSLSMFSFLDNFESNWIIKSNHHFKLYHIEDSVKNHHVSISIRQEQQGWILTHKEICNNPLWSNREGGSALNCHCLLELSLSMDTNMYNKHRRNHVHFLVKFLCKNLGSVVILI